MSYPERETIRSLSAIRQAPESRVGHAPPETQKGDQPRRKT